MHAWSRGGESNGESLRSIQKQRSASSGRQGAFVKWSPTGVLTKVSAHSETEACPEGNKTPAPNLEPPCENNTLACAPSRVWGLWQSRVCDTSAPQGRNLERIGHRRCSGSRRAVSADGCARVCVCVEKEVAQGQRQPEPTRMQ